MVRKRKAKAFLKNSLIREKMKAALNSQSSPESSVHQQEKSGRIQSPNDSTNMALQLLVFWSSAKYSSHRSQKFPHPPFLLLFLPQVQWRSVDQTGTANAGLLKPGACFPHPVPRLLTA